MFKCVHNLNPDLINDIFVVKDMPRELPDPCILAIPRFNKIMYGKRTFSYYGAHLWNLLPSNFKEALNFNDFKKLLSKWEGPQFWCNVCIL